MGRRLFAAVLAAATAAGIPAANAAGLSVSPMNVQMAPGRTAAQVTLQAGAGAQVPVQARVFRWEQRNGEDALVPTTDVVASPPAARLVAGQRGVIRLLRVSKAPIGREESYRVLIDQVPQARGSNGASVTLAVRYSIPVFVTPAGWSAPDLRWQARREGSRLVLTATNAGNTRAKITGLSLAGAGGRGKIERNGLIGYVLAGASKTWEFDAGNGAFPSGGDLRIEAETQSAGTLSETVAIR